MCCAVLTRTEVKLQVPDCSPRRTKGCLESVDWTSYWTGILEWTKML